MLIEQPYVDFLQFCLDDHEELPANAKNIDWKRMLIWAEQQAIVGVIFNGIQKADKNLSIPANILLQWIGYANLIEKRNLFLNKRCVELTEYLKHNGWEACILKGQGNALAYPNVLSRTPGDIDVWVRPDERLRVKGDRLKIRDVIRFVRERNPKTKACYHHVDFGEFNGVEVEMHYRPSFMFNPVHNHRLQKFFFTQKARKFVELPEGAGRIEVPKWEFNILFQLSHVYNHLLHEGIGLKQIIDYFYLLRSEDKLTMDNGQLTILLRRLGLEKIAGAMMWVLNEMLGLPEEYLIAPKDEKRGKVLWAEMMSGGNFGRGLKSDGGWLSGDMAIGRNWLRLKRDIRLVRYFPSECLWEPVFRVYHCFWRLCH